jgi:tRNA pseudouridine55 synthase
VNGVLLVDKEPGMTSHDVVARARRTLGIRSIGHAGTLDPLASGLLLLLVGEATKISDYLLNGDKSYEVTVRMGLETDSMDITGKVLKETSLRDSQGQFLQEVSEARVREVSLSATGVLSLEVPVHSAVKVGGKKLYELAHKGERPEEIPVREMTFYGLQWLSWSPETSEFTMRISCSKGSFIRAWANYVGGLLGFGGTVSALRRVESAPFNVAKAKQLGAISDLWENREGRAGEALGSSWVPLDEALPHFGRIEVAGQDAALLKNGQISKAVQAELLRKIQLGTQPAPIRVIDREENRLLALLAAEPGEFYKIRRVFQP